MIDVEVAVRTTVTLDDKQLAEATEYTGIQEKSALIREALKVLIQREAAHRLILLGGSAPEAKIVPRRRIKL